MSAQSEVQPTGAAWISRLAAVVRVLFGISMLTFGLNAFLYFIPQPETPLSDGAMAFSTALFQTGYMLPLIGVTQLVVGALLLINRFVPLSLVLFAPFILNAILFHTFLEHNGLPMAALYLVFGVFLAWYYRAAYRPLLTARFSRSG